MAPAQNRRSNKRPRATQPITATSSRAPRRCRVCPGFPLKSTCACSKQHGNVLNGEIVPTATTTWDEGHTQNMLRLQDLGDNGQEDPRPVEPPDALLDNRALTETTLPTPGAADSVCETLIDPALLALEQSQIPHPTVVPEATTCENEDEVPSQPKKINRLGATEKATKYGLVDGVMRGNTVYRISRQNEKRKAISDASSATTRYNRELPLIISRAERLALETDAYIVILAQQATGSSASVHFASERMRRDALDQCSDLVNHFQSLMTQLVIAKRSTTLALTRNLEESEKARAQAEEKLMERDNAVATAEAELAASNSANRALLAELEALRSSLSCSPQRPS